MLTCSKDSTLSLVHVPTAAYNPRCDMSTAALSWTPHNELATANTLIDRGDNDNGRNGTHTITSTPIDTTTYSDSTVLGVAQCDYNHKEEGIVQVVKLETNGPSEVDTADDSEEWDGVADDDDDDDDAILVPDIDPQITAYLAKNYMLFSGSVDEKCQHNARIAARVSRYQDATVWDMVRLLFVTLRTEDQEARENMQLMEELGAANGDDDDDDDDNEETYETESDNGDPFLNISEYEDGAYTEEEEEDENDDDEIEDSDHEEIGDDEEFSDDIGNDDDQDDDDDESSDDIDAFFDQRDGSLRGFLSQNDIHTHGYLPYEMDNHVMTQENDQEQQNLMMMMSTPSGTPPQQHFSLDAFMDTIRYVSPSSPISIPTELSPRHNSVKDISMLAASTHRPVDSVDGTDSVCGTDMHHAPPPVFRLTSASQQRQHRRHGREVKSIRPSSTIPNFETVIYDVLDFYVEQGDVQMCVALVATLRDMVHLDTTVILRWYLSYIDLLRQLKLFVEAAEVIKYAPYPIVNSMNQQYTSVRTSCGACGEAMLGKMPYCTNEKCTKYQRPIVCMICHLPIVGSAVIWCKKCGHGGHMHHMIRYFSRQSHCPICRNHVTQLQSLHE